ncbi:hypothetical protein VNO78_09391 [Psophocarpus tetragonolobus]|uniref:RNase H type-1 domain-containing protein n=1 Tax=Psophocarpus tetragonolobus TaxID=3891 RepID=A0AAN9XUC2_PSOTE
MSGGNDGNEGWGSRFLKMASAAAAAAAVAGGLYAALSSSASASGGHQEVPFGGQPHRNQPDHAGHVPPLQGAHVASWKKPEIGWVKLNVDGSRDHFNDTSAGCGGVFRDSSAKWVYGFAKRLNPDNNQAHQTELEAILTGLNIASKLNIKKLIVESDSEPVVRMVMSGVKSSHTDYDLVQRIRNEVDRIGCQVRFAVVSNKVNRVAHRLANDARKFASVGLCEEYADPPFNCLELLLEDQNRCQTF